MTQEAIDASDSPSYNCDSDSTTSEISFVQSSEGDYGIISEGDEFVVSEGEHSAYTEGSSVYDNDPFEDPDSEPERAAEVSEIVRYIPLAAYLWDLSHTTGGP